MRHIHDDNLKWIMSQRSGANGNCVEVASHGADVLICDSKYLRDPSNPVSQQPILALSHDQWGLFKLAVVGERHYAEPSAALHPSGAASVRAGDGTTLEFTPAEWQAFTLGVLDGDFDSIAT